MHFWQKISTSAGTESDSNDKQVLSICQLLLKFLKRKWMAFIDQLMNKLDCPIVDQVALESWTLIFMKFDPGFDLRFCWVSYQYIVEDHVMSGNRQKAVRTRSFNSADLSFLKEKNFPNGDCAMEYKDCLDAPSAQEGNQSDQIWIGGETKLRKRRA
jgi:hypothetical protein